MWLSEKVLAEHVRDPRLELQYGKSKRRTDSSIMTARNRDLRLPRKNTREAESQFFGQDVQVLFWYFSSSLGLSP